MSTTNPINNSGPNASGPASLERLYDLLATRALEEITTTESAELDALLRQHPQVDPASFDLAAASAFMEPRADAKPSAHPAALPTELADRIALAAVAELTANAAAHRSKEASSDRGSFRIAHARPRLARSITLSWLAAAAGLALAAVSWWPRIFPAAISTVAQQRQALLAQASDAKALPWAPQADPTAKGMAGDIVWSDSLNRGYIRFTGLAANDPKANQYQLWIFDAKGADANFPVDGGVFDIPAGVTEAIILIDAKIRVGQAAVFAVTVERPGGVVVTTKERLVALAKP